MSGDRRANLGWCIASVVLGLVLTALALVAVGADPFECCRVMWNGAFGNSAKFANVFLTWIPLTLCSVGLLIAFTAGLWNIGVEGQVVMGAIAAAWVARTIHLPSPVLIPVLFISGMMGGALWALLAGVLKTHGKVHEIFGGLGLNFVATAFALYLIMGPWKREGIASTSGTAPFGRAAWLPTFSDGLPAGPVEIVLTIITLATVHYLLHGTLFGLRLKATGKNIRSAFWMGIRTNCHALGAFALCGMFAGTAGAFQAVGVWHRLIPSISGGYGYLAILVVLLSGFQAGAVPFIAFFFSAISKGSVALPLDLNLDSSLGGVLQGIMALLFVLSWGVRKRLRRGKAPRVT